MPQILDRVLVGAATLTRVISALSSSPDTTFALARIDQGRDEAARRYVELKKSDQELDASEVVDWLKALPALWEAADPSGRRMVTEAIFAKGRGPGRPVCRYPPHTRGRSTWMSDAFGHSPLLLAASGGIATDGRVGEETDRHRRPECLTEARL